MTSRFQNTRIAPLSIAAFLLVLLACPLTGGWAQTMEMNGGIKSTGDINSVSGYVMSQKNKISTGNASVGMLSASSAYMIPSFWGYGDTINGGVPYGLYLFARPDSSDTTVNSNLFSMGGIYMSPRKNATSSLLVTTGNLLRVDNYNSHRMSLTYDGQLRLGSGIVPSTSSTFATAPIYVTGATCSAYLSGESGHWAVQSTRASKTNIRDLSIQDAWVQLDSFTPVEFEYRKTKTLIRMKDGREALYSDAMAEAEKLACSRVGKGEELPPAAAQEALAEIVAGEPYNVWTDEPSGFKTRGFIAEDLPEGITAPDHKSYAPALVTVANTAALKEAKRRIEAQEKEIETLNARLAKLEGTGTKALTGAVASTSSAITLTQAEVEAVADRALVELGLLTEVEVAAADAFETVPETQTVESVETVTRYRYDAATGAVEKFETQAVVQREKPTGQTVRRLKEGVRFDDTTGKFLRLMVAPTAPASETEGLAKLLAPALRARFAAALRTQGAPAPARAVSMNLK